MSKIKAEPCIALPWEQPFIFIARVAARKNPFLLKLQSSPLDNPAYGKGTQGLTAWQKSLRKTILEYQGVG